MYRLVSCLVSLVCLFLLTAADDVAEGDARARSIAPYLDGQTLGIVHLDVTRVDVDALADKLTVVTKLDAEELAPFKKRAGQFALDFMKAGGKDLYVVVSLADLPGPPFLIAPLSAEADTAALGRVLSEPGGLHLETAEKLDQVMFAGSKSALARLKAAKPAARPEVARAFAAAGDKPVQVLLMPTHDARRIVEEVFPRLPKEFGAGPSSALTHGLLWAAIGLDLTPKASMKVVVQSQNAPAAEAFHQVIVSFFKMLAQEERPRQLIPHFDKAAAVLTPAVTGDQLMLSLDAGSEGAGELLAQLGASVIRADQRMRSTNHLKQIGLALHIYHDVNNRFPTTASYSKDGKPLLSWRVHILPYVEQQRLYQEFHLDEPWDSEHNKKLIARMPPVYRGLSLKAALEGKTPYLAPAGATMLFTGTAQPVQIKEVTDGTSNTIMVVEATSNRAVIWTKPDDLAVDSKDPAAGLLTGQLTGFNALFADGAVHFITARIDRKTLYALFTKNGGEVVGRDGW